jgi:SAM-dependent methyltransferase
MNLTFLKTRFNGLKIYLKKYLQSLVIFLSSRFFASARWFIVAREKMQDLRATNLELGIFHLQNGNVEDAIFRFKLVDKLFSPHDPKAKFMLGWCYIIKQRFTNAKSFFEASQDPSAKEIINFIDSENLQEIPENILMQYYEYWADKIDENIHKNESNLLEKFFTIQTNILEALPNNAKILELGCKTGFIGAKLNSYMKKVYSLEAVEISQRMCRMALNKASAYDKVHCNQINSYLASTKDKFDLILAFKSLNIYKNFSTTLKLLHKTSPEAKVIIGLKGTNNPGINFDSSKFNFVYDTDSIEAEVNSSGYKIETLEIVQDGYSEKYYIFICSSK